MLVVLPVDAAPEIALRFLAAGKHVLQEKPAAPDVATAVAALQRHAALPPPRALWAIAENYRSERVFRNAAAVLAGGALGDIVKLDLAADMPMNAANKYFGSTWRRDAAACPGAFLMDSSVHFVAALRALAAVAGLGEAAHAAGRAYSTTGALPPPDALVGFVGFQGGRGATVSISFGCALPRFSLAATGTRGALEVRLVGSIPRTTCDDAAAPCVSRHWESVNWLACAAAASAPGAPVPQHGHCCNGRRKRQGSSCDCPCLQLVKHGCTVGQMCARARA